MAGLALLFRQVNGMSAFLALATIVAYLAIYTPAKRWSRWNTEIGAISGALPPMIGWAAATGVLWAFSYYFWRRLQAGAASQRARSEATAVRAPIGASL